MRVEDPNQFEFNFWPMRFSVKGLAAIAIFAVPISLLLIALAWRIVGLN